jgi:leucyl aminopeptidase
MPLDDDYAEGLKTTFADVANVAGRRGLGDGRQVPAALCGRHSLGAPGHRWHRLEEGAAKGGTGRPVGLLVHYLLGQVAAAKTAAGEGQSAPGGGCGQGCQER